MSFLLNFFLSFLLSFFLSFGGAGHGIPDLLVAVMRTVRTLFVTNSILR